VAVYIVHSSNLLSFTDRYYDNPEHIKELGGIDIGKYIASGIVVFNLDTKQVKWTADLDLSTENGNFRAHAYSSPTVVDLVMEIWTSLLELPMACFMSSTIMVNSQPHNMKCCIQKLN
jgi:hypothetical protein